MAQHALAYLPAFFFNATATPEIYTLSLHDALPISLGHSERLGRKRGRHHRAHHARLVRGVGDHVVQDRKSTRLNSSHQIISYAVFCLKKKKESCVPTTSDSSDRSTTNRYIGVTNSE